jgi:hypothetical protein
MFRQRKDSPDSANSGKQPTTCTCKAETEESEEKP